MHGLARVELHGHGLRLTRIGVDLLVLATDPAESGASSWTGVGPGAPRLRDRGDDHVEPLDLEVHPDEEDEEESWH